MRGGMLRAESIYLGILAKMPASRDALRGVAQLAIATGRYQGRRRHLLGSAQILSQ